MNYFELHLGDYAEATLHLTFLEDAAYFRLIRKYYATERPLPADVKAVQRLVGARTRDERAAVQAMLEEFFVLREDGWHNARCDEEIARYVAGEPERLARRANQETRVQRHREARTALFEALRAVGVTPGWNAPIAELRALAAQHGVAPATPHETLHGTAPETLPGTAPATPATATHTPDTRHQTPDTNLKSLSVSAEGAREPSAKVTTIGIPPSVNREALARWEQWLASKGKPVNDISRTAIARNLAAFGDATAQAEAVEHSIRGQWITLHAPKTGPADAGPGQPRRTRFEQLTGHLQSGGEHDDAFG